MNVGKKKQERPPRKLFRSWMRDSANTSVKPGRLIRNVASKVSAETALSNHLIIAEILKHVTDAEDLLNCRLVSLRWTPIATARLLQLNMQCTGLRYYYNQKCYRSSNGQLSELIDCARNSVTFPCTSFTFRAGDMRSKDAKEFWTFMGTSVKTLTLDAVDNGSLCGKMNLSDILSRTPNLQTLIFNGGSYYDFTPTHRLTLPALKTIKLSCQWYTSVADIQLILSGAKNLETFAGAWRLDDVTPIVDRNKIHTVKSWCPSKVPFPGGLVRLTTATEGKLILNELLISIHHTEWNNEISTETLWKCFRKLLDANTIQKLILCCSKYPATASFPINMDSVKELILMPMSSPGRLKHFPIGISLNATFPRVDTLSLYDKSYQSCCAGTKWENCFPLSNPVEAVGALSSVTTLNLRQKSVSIRMLRRMKTICPNAQNLELYLHEDLEKEDIIKELCGEWRNLKTLSIHLINENANLVSLDSAFSGLKAESLTNLHSDQSLTGQEKLRKAEDSRYVLWIGNIGGLTELNIYYEVPNYSSLSTAHTLIPFTEYSGLYAFNLMTDLKVNLHYQKGYDFSNDDELNTALASISPFATISGQ